MKKLQTGKNLLRMLLLGAIMTIVLAGTALADGWEKIGSKIYYSAAAEDGTTVQARGMTKIDGKTYYFNDQGVLQTGWIVMTDGVRYFKKSGGLGTRGKMLTGLRIIKSKKYYFDPKTGYQQTGLITVKGNTYYFKKTKDTTPGVNGVALTKKFATYEGGRYYFDANGVMVKSRWVGSYYLGEDGKKLVSTVTPDSYLVDAKGKKIRKVKTGLVEIDGVTYYWSKSKKQFLTNTTKVVDEITYIIDENGVATPKPDEEDSDENTGDGTPKILIVAGHGQGDSGAVGVAQEYLKTREFAKLIYTQLKASDKLEVTYLQNGSTAYDLYQRHVAALKGETITGKGTNKKTIKELIKSNASLPKLYEYDYVLEIHFNATGTASKDLKGDDNYKGFGFYINQYKKSSKLEASICTQIKALGFKIWGGGVLKSETLYNARICQELGVDYSLLETAFIDDADDMKFYNANKQSMAKVIADSIIAYYGKEPASTSTDNQS